MISRKKVDATTYLCFKHYSIKRTGREIIYIIKNQSTHKAKLNYVIDAVSKNGGIEYTIDKMNDYKQEALGILRSFPPSEIRKGFEELVNFVTDRKY